MLKLSSTWLKLPQPLLAMRNSVRHFKVTVVGAGGGIGQPLSLLLKQVPLINSLALHDLAQTEGVRADLSHVATSPRIESYTGDPELNDALFDAHVVVVAAGLPRKPGMTRDQLLDANAGVAAKVASAVSIACPHALLAFITNPVNTIVPIAAEYLKAKKAFDPNKLFGVTTLDVVRSRTFIADFMNTNPKDIHIPVIGGHAGITILPLFSSCKPCFKGHEDDVIRLTKRIQEAGTEVVKAKAGKGSATLSMAYAATHFVKALLRGLNGEENVVECSYVASDVTDLAYFSTPLLLGRGGIELNLGLPKMADFEEKALKQMMPILKKNIETGIEYAEKAIAGSTGDQKAKKKSVA